MKEIRRVLYARLPKKNVPRITEIKYLAKEKKGKPKKEFDAKVKTNPPKENPKNASENSAKQEMHHNSVQESRALRCGPGDG